MAGPGRAGPGRAGPGLSDPRLPRRSGPVRPARPPSPSPPPPRRLKPPPRVRESLLRFNRHAPPRRRRRPGLRRRTQQPAAAVEAFTALLGRRRRRASSALYVLRVGEASSGSRCDSESGLTRKAYVRSGIQRPEQHGGCPARLDRAWQSRAGPRPSSSRPANGRATAFVCCDVGSIPTGCTLKVWPWTFGSKRACPKQLGYQLG